MPDCDTSVTHGSGMEALAKHPRLWNRNGRHHHHLRARVPLDLVEIIGKAEIRFRLDTSNHKAAAAKLNVENVKLEAQFPSPP